ncbi:sensor domain-containing diguanylate cyclase [Undibacterium squillarum]|nr:diguanylate cyclase [Undibacterium squillarum]
MPLRLQRHLLTMTCGLVTGLSLPLWLLAEWQLREQAASVPQASLQRTEQSLHYLEQQQTMQLSSAASLLATDESFRQAVQQRRAETIVPALIRHAAQQQATLAVLVDAQGELLYASSDSLAHGLQSDWQSWARAQPATNGGWLLSGSTAMLGAQSVSVTADGTKVLLARPVTDALLQPVSQLSGNHLSLLRKAGTKPWQVSQSTLPAARRQQLTEILSDAPKDLSTLQVQLERRDFATRQLALPSDPKAQHSLLLQTAVAPVTGPLLLLQRCILIAGLTGLFTAAILTLFSILQLERWIQHISERLIRLRGGSYGTPEAMEMPEEMQEIVTHADALRSTLQQQHQQLQHQLWQDPLTGLPNRARFLQMTEEAIRSARQQQDGPPRLSMVLIEPQHYWQVRLQAGGEAAEQWLMQYVRQLSQCLGTQFARPARVTEACFALLLPACDAAEATAYLQQWQTQMQMQTQAATASASDGGQWRTGIACSETHGNDAAGLLHHAEAGLRSMTPAA